MPSRPDPELGINSWLEEELYREYLHDRSAVDESWKTVFEQGNGSSGAGRGQSRARAALRRPGGSRAGSRRPAPAPARGGRADRREHGRQRRHSAGHFAAHHRRQGDGREPAHHQPAPDAARPRQGLLHAHHRLGHRQGAGRGARAQSRLRGERRAALPRGAAAGQPGNRGGCGRQGRRAQPDGSEHQERRRAELPGVPRRLRRPGGPRALEPTDAGRFPGHHHLAHQSGHGGHHGLQSAADAGPGRHHRRRRHRLSGRIPGRGRRDARHPRHRQGHDPHLHLRPPRHTGRGVGPVSGQSAGASRWRRRLLRGDFRAPAHAAPAGALGEATASRCCPA